MVRIIYILDKMESIIDTMVTFSMVAVIFFGIGELMPIIASCLAIAYWIPRIKREISINYKNKLSEYIKSLFRKNNRYK